MSGAGSEPPPVGRAAFALGFAGLLPQAAAVVLEAVGVGYDLGGVLAFGYGALILSFLGGIWWGTASRRKRRQGALVGLAVLPSLAAAGLGLGAALVGLPWALVGLGCAIMLTLPVDRQLVATGEAPANWMSLRVPLSLGLGGLTIVVGAIAGAF